MKLFVLTSRIPYPLEKGDKLRIYHQIKELSKRHRIFLCALYQKESHVEEAKKELSIFCEELYFIKISKYQQCISLISACFNHMPFQSALFYDRNAKQQVLGIINKVQPNHIYCQLTRVAEYLKEIKQPKTLDYMDAFSKGMKRRAKSSSIFSAWLFYWESKKQKQYERELFSHFKQHTIISAQDLDAIDHPQKSTIKIIPNGVDFKHFKPINSKKKYDLTFVGNMSYAPNVDAAIFLCEDILPLIQKQCPDVKLLIAGASPSNRVKQLASEVVTVSGWIDDIREAYAATRVFIAPMRIGTGLQNKLLEAMAMRIPCITSPLANKSLRAKETEIVVAKSAADIAHACVKLLNNTTLRNEIASKGFDFVTKHYQWPKTTATLEQLFMDK